MERHYSLPIAFAAAFHAALLFGFSKPPRNSAIPIEPKKPGDFIIHEVELEPPLPVEGQTDAGPTRQLPDAPRPTQAEPLMLDVPTNFQIPVPRPQPVDGIDTKQILPQSFERADGNGPGGWGDIIPSIGLDKAPRTRFQPSPSYPLPAKQQGLRGEVMVEFVVDETGRVHDPRVVSSTDRVFEEPTLRAVARWVFEPGRRDGRIVRFRMAAPVVFNLHD